VKLPVAIGGPTAAALTGLVALAGELDLSHPAKQAIIIAGGLVIAIVGYFTISPPSTPAASTAPPFSIPDPLPTPAPAPTSAPARSVIDRAALEAASRSLP
jgi:hypothetical protein